jgi:integrase
VRSSISPHKRRARTARFTFRFDSSEECGALYNEVSGRDHVAIRILVQLGLRSEEWCALRRNDVREHELVIDEAVVNSRTKEPKTLASASSVFVPPNLATELRHYLETIHPSPTAWLFPSSHKDVPIRPANFLKRVLKPAAIRAGIAITQGRQGQGNDGAELSISPAHVLDAVRREGERIRNRPKPICTTRTRK